jgi:hypothetical protein
MLIEVNQSFEPPMAAQLVVGFVPIHMEVL